MVQWFGNQAGIFTVDGQLKANLTVNGAFRLRGVARQDTTLFITDYTSPDKIHVLLENNTYITTIQDSRLIELKNIVIIESTIWVNGFKEGVYKLTIDCDYNITHFEVLVPDRSPSHVNPMSLHVQDRHIIVLYHGTHDIHFFNACGDETQSAVGGLGSGDGQLEHPIDMVVDSDGRMYIAFNHRIVLFSSDGQFIRNLVTDLKGEPLALYLRYNTLFVATQKPVLLYIIKLI